MSWLSLAIQIPHLELEVGKGLPDIMAAIQLEMRGAYAKDTTKENSSIFPSFCFIE